jgi:exportin-7
LISQNRKIVNSFREKCILPIFKIAITSINQLFTSGPPDPTKDHLKAEAVDLALKCLCFDFLGTNPDESSDTVDRHEIQIPAAWKPLFETPSQLPTLFYSIYSTNKPPLSDQVHCTRE